MVARELNEHHLLQLNSVFKRLCNYPAASDFGCFSNAIRLAEVQRLRMCGNFFGWLDNWVELATLRVSLPVFGEGSSLLCAFEKLQNNQR